MTELLRSLALAAPPVTASAAALGGAVGLAAYATFAPRSGLWGAVRHFGTTEQPDRVALTFDDGPTPGPTERVLDALRELNAPAAFFVIGANAERWPHLVERMHAEGHVIGNHTFDHPRLGVLRRHGYWRRQVEETDRIVEQITGKRPALFRPPMGFKTWHVLHAASATGHATVTWTRRAFDTVTKEPSRVVNRLVGPASAGDILLLHDGVEPNTRAPRRGIEHAIRPLVHGLRSRGLEPERLDRLLGVEGYAAQPRSGGED